MDLSVLDDVPAVEVPLGMDLTNVSNLTREQLDSAVTDEHTRLPAELEADQQPSADDPPAT